MRSEFVRWKQNRKALMMDNGSLQVTVLAGGGHLAELRLVAAGTLSPNLLWESSWTTEDPDSAEFSRLGELYGGAPTGPFLAGYTGHALCVDIFGPPSQEEAALGIPLHGEASAKMWDVVPTPDGCELQVELPLSQLDFSRTIRAGKGALFIEECLTNTGPSTREVHWVQHASLGAPLLSAEDSLIAASVDHCKTWPLGYEDRQILADDTEFVWPFAPTIGGGATDMRLPFQHEGKGFVAAAHVAEGPTVAYVAALNPRAGIALIYCFRRDDFPWVAVWEENGARSSPPWNGSVKVRGMEFGTTPMPLGREPIHEMGDLFDTPVSCVLSSGAKRYARFAICAGAIPSYLRTVEAIGVSDKGLTLTAPDAADSVVIPADGVLQFLTERQNPA